MLTDASREATFHKEYADGQWLDVENNTVGYGLGWDSVDLYPFNLYGIQAVTKGGDTLLMHNSLIVLPEYGLSAAVSSSGGSSAYCQMLATSLLLDQLEEKGIITERLSALDSFTPAEQTALDADVKQYEGLYGDSTSLMRLTMDDAGTLTLTNAYAPTQAQTYIYCGNGLFKHETGALELRFTEQNGRTYLTYRGYSAIDGLCDVVSETYYLEKLPENAVTDEMQAAWAAREGKAYVSVTDKASSQLYMSGLPMLGIGTVDGYLLSNPLTSDSRADVAIQIPMMGGRDTSPFVFETIDGVEYVHYTDGLYMDISAVPDIYTGTQSSPDHPAQWLQPLVQPARSAGRQSHVHPRFREHGFCRVQCSGPDRQPERCHGRHTGHPAGRRRDRVLRRSGRPHRPDDLLTKQKTAPWQQGAVSFSYRGCRQTAYSCPHSSPLYRVIRKG